MLERITILKLRDLGQLAEIMLFYGKVSVYFDEDQLNSLFKQVHPDVFIPFLEEHKDNIELHYLDSGVSTYENLNFPESVYFSIGNEQVAGDTPFLEYLEDTCYLYTPNGVIENEKLTKRLLNLVRKEDVRYDIFNDVFLNGLRAEELDKFFQGYINRFRPPGLLGIPSGLHLSVENGFLGGSYNSLTTPIGFSMQQTNGYTLRIHAESELSKQEIRCIKDMFRLYISTMSELPIWASTSSELLSDNKESFAVKSKINYLISLRNKSKRKIDSFQNIFISDTRNLRKVINNGDKSFSDFIKLYEKSRKFRDWISRHPADSNLLHEYYSAVCSDPIKLDTKRADCYQLL